MASRKKSSLVPSRKPSGLKTDGTPNVAWRKFKERLAVYDSIPVENWQMEELLGYMFDRYRKHFGFEFSLSYSGPPSKCREIYCVRRMMIVLANDDSAFLKAYIDWVFDKKIIATQAELKSIAYFFHPSVCNEFKSKYSKQNRITKTTELPTQYKDIIETFSLSAPVDTYGDLAFVKMAIDSNPDRDDIDSYTQMFKRLRDVGFNDVILTTLPE